MSSQKVYEIEPTNIYAAGDRQRQIFNPKDMSILINSIKTVGQIQPGVCFKNAEGKIEVLVGERRLRACETIGIPYKFILKEEVTDKYILERIQLEENLIRESLTWQEEIFALEKIQLLLAKTEGYKTLQETSDYLGISKTMLSEDIQLAAWIREVPEVAAAPNKTTAKKMVKQLATSFNRDVALEKSFEEIQEKKSQEFDRESIRQKLANYNETHPEEPLEEKEFIKRKHIPEQESKSNLSFQEERMLEYDRRCILGTMEKQLSKFPNGHFNLVFFDPPWGVNYDKSQKGAEYQKKYEDSKQKFLDEFPARLQMIYDKMAKDSHIYIFFGIVNHSFIYDSIEACGFKTSRMPLFWHKLGAHRTRVPEWEYGRCYEAIAFARKGLKKLQGSPIADIIPTPQPTPRIKDIHPSAKHPEIYKILLEKSAYPGDKVLDPMGGSGMMGVAADELRLTHNLDWTQIEMDKDYRNLQIFNLVKGYYHFTLNTINLETPTEDLETDFHKIPVGSDKWKQFWKANPEQQDEMLEWKMKQPEE